MAQNYSFLDARDQGSLNLAAHFFNSACNWYRVGDRGIAIRDCLARAKQARLHRNPLQNAKHFRRLP